MPSGAHEEGMFVIEPARASEAAELARLANENLSAEMDGDLVVSMAEKDALMVARDARTDDILGFCACRREDACEAHLLALAVDKNHQGEGVGSALLKHLQDTMFRTGARSLELDVRSDNTRAQEFYARHGFEPAGLERHAYSDGADAVHLRRPI